MNEVFEGSIELLEAPLDPPLRDPGIPASYPPALAKACLDEFCYMLGLRNGQRFYFRSAEVIDANWVRITVDTPFLDPPGKNEPTFDRGIDMRVDEIAWVADAPYGS